MITRQKLWLRSPIHFLEQTVDIIEMQDLDVVQAVVHSVVLMKVTADKVGKMDEARMNEGPGRVTENDRLKFCNRKEESELNKVGHELEPAIRDSTGGEVGKLQNQSLSFDPEKFAYNNKLRVSGLIFWRENILG